MLECSDFKKKQIIFMFTCRGERISFKNDNIVITDKEGKVKYQVTCYLIFALYVVGETSITTGLIRRAKKFGFVICLMTQSFKLYSIIGNRMEGNTILHRKQYYYDGDDIAAFLVLNKITNQRFVLNQVRSKTPGVKDAIVKLDSYIEEIRTTEYNNQTLLGIEGSAARVYFTQVFNNTAWKGRKPRIKFDYVNSTLDIGYNLLFNLVDSLLQVYGFDVYCGVYHKEFYMRKSLACDLMEPIRPVIDREVRKAINLKQCKVDDFQIFQGQYCLEYKKSSEYVSFFMKALLEYKEEIFYYVQQYYRSFMKEKNGAEFRRFRMEAGE